VRVTETQTVTIVAGTAYHLQRMVGDKDIRQENPTGTTHVVRVVRELPGSE
jgi:hypothetical protein